MSCAYIVDLGAIVEVRRWPKILYHQMKKAGKHEKRLDAILSEDLCWTIYYDEDKEYNLIGPDEETVEIWMETLDKLVSVVRAVRQENEYYL